MRVLIIDDEPDVVEALTLTFNMQWQGCEVLAAYDGESGINTFYKESPDVVILDIAMPELTGFEVLRHIREVSDVPVLMLTVKDQEMDKVKALELGADDYITKPFSPLELLARIRAVLRRAEMPPPVTAYPSFSSGELEINFASREVKVRSQLVKLTPREYNLLVYLVRNAGRVLPAQTLLTKVWGDEYGSDLDSLKVYVRRLREKLEEEPHRPQYILTERGVGYKFTKPA